jgi:site-specific recombinase XerD
VSTSTSMTWQVHFTRRWLPWPAEPRPLLTHWEPGDLVAWLRAEGILDGLPFLLDPEGRYDVALNRYFLHGRIAAGPENTQRAIAYDLANWLNFLWFNRRQTSWRDATSEDRAAYKTWRRNDPDGPHVAGATWNREVATVNSFYRWAVRKGLVRENPIEQRPTRDRDGHHRRAVGAAETPAEAAHDARRVALAWLPPASYRRWRDVGIRGYRPDGLADRSFRGRHASRNQAFCDLMVRTGLRVSEQVSLTRFELPEPDDQRVYYPTTLPVVIAKRGSGRVIYIPRSALRSVWDYLRFERTEAVEHARAQGRYETLPDLLIVEDPTLPRVPLVQRDGRVRWVGVDRLGHRERARLLLRTPQGLEPAALWLDEQGMPTGVDGWKKVFATANRRCARAGVNLRCHPHVLRHSFAVVTLEQLQRGHLRDLEQMNPGQRPSYQMVFGDPLRWVSLRLGHASTQTALVYLHTLAELEFETKLALVPDDDEWEPPELHPDDVAAELGARQTRQGSEFDARGNESAEPAG